MVRRLVYTLLLDEDRRLAVEVTGFELALGDILGLHEGQRIHNTADQVIGSEDDHLVVHIGIGHIQTESLHQTGLCAAVTGVLLDDHCSLRIVGRDPFAVLQHRQTESNPHKDHKEIPIVGKSEDPLNGVELCLLF